MKTTTLLIGIITASQSLFGQSYTYKPLPPTPPNTIQLLEKYKMPESEPYTYPTTYPSSTPSQSIPQKQLNKTISLENKSYNAREVQLYVMDYITFTWLYLKTVRVPGGEAFSQAIGKYENQHSYGYIITGGISNSVTSFSTYPVIIY